MWLPSDHQVSNAARTPEEVAFLRAVEFSDVTAVRRLLGDNPHLNVDAIDALGRTALRLAVRNENRELVEMLLERCSSQNIHEAALQAISEDHTSIAEQILRHGNYLELCRKRHRLGDVDGFFKTEVESQFSTDITPLNLAAQKNNYAIVQLLLLRGDSIQKPHKFSCGCVECRNRMKFDQLRMANFRLNAYRGLASEAYISLSSEDPFLTAFQLAKELRTLSNEEKHFKKEYKDLANNLSNYLVSLLDKVWTQSELEVVLNKDESAEADKNENLSRLRMAIDQREKKFVAHPSVQQHVVRIWHQGLDVLDTDRLLVRLACLTGLVLVYPFMAIAHLMCPDFKRTKLAKQPMVKFMGNTISFFFFLLLIILSSTESMNRVSNNITLNTQYKEIAEHYQDYRKALGSDIVTFGEDFPLRPREPTMVEFLITIWIAGMLVQELQQIVDVGAGKHFHDLFNVLDFCLLVVYTSVFVLVYWTMHKSKLAISELQGKNVTMLLADGKGTLLHLYWLNEDRLRWDPMDPINIAESLFALANILSFTRICYLLPANESLGPMQISLGRMINDILQFVVFLCIAMVAFIVSLRNLYSFYTEDAQGSKRADAAFKTS
ncbi:short transient receptor potential channel 6-like [Pomacea canaliculata]|uniref:short transient receptor potential channel 6-like n=1 Tax=Pomacea canaliculata TaxID=400727 RepID=UPI000D73EAD2|nr:short transient receptor potential channel 6-like [Pomacea canaliculata]XP_025087045.1 short transient receptor potential channel 6-like [Pomacea canaliculata]XP_025087046.1 short transient receptor potential channel 6-like [Pomacea canaliculata]XP_025087047.1 short transient receptor potential channel 6-like [Pomacea canaliculata]XP_025087048.1 short transient receptor potential channel 6-like [Pomacea canaliculata]XP_025087049.1 short transient receptor potential channel 6-like [Pomacea c